MEYDLYRFDRRWALIARAENYSRIDAYGTVAHNGQFISADTDSLYTDLDPLTLGIAAIDAQPTAAQCGTSNALYYRYREAIGQPLTVYDFIDAKRLFLIPDRNYSYDGAHYMMRVVGIAANNRCLPSLMSALARLCCRDDCVIVMSPDTPVGSFFWRQFTVEEFDTAMTAYNITGQFITPNRQFYHGGLIGHRAYKDNKPTDIMDWSVHT